MRRRDTRILLIGATFGAAATTTAAIIATLIFQRPKPDREMVLAYYVAPPPMVDEYRELKKGDPAAHWLGSGPYLAAKVSLCGVTQFRLHLADGITTGWSNAPSREIAMVPLRGLTTKTASCLARLVDPPHVFASLPSPEQEPAVVNHFIHYIPPL